MDQISLESLVIKLSKSCHCRLSQVVSHRQYQVWVCMSDIESKVIVSMYVVCWMDLQPMNRFWLNFRIQYLYFRPYHRCTKSYFEKYIKNFWQKQKLRFFLHVSCSFLNIRVLGDYWEPNNLTTGNRGPKSEVHTIPNSVTTPTSLIFTLN